MRSTITAGLLAKILARTEPHVRQGDGRSGLNGIRLEADGDHLFAVATDRYTVAVARASAVSDGPWHALLHRDSIPAVKQWLGGLDPWVDVRVGAARSEDTTAVTFRCGPAMLRAVNTCIERESFPLWRGVVRNVITADAERVDYTGFTSKYLARFEKVEHDRGLHAWQVAANRPLVLASDDGFIGMIMPVSRDGARSREDVVTEWTDVLNRRFAAVNGHTYDLTRPWLDTHTDPWSYSGDDDITGQPLMVMGGLDTDPWPLAEVLAEFGPLTPA